MNNRWLGNRRAMLIGAILLGLVVVGVVIFWQQSLQRDVTRVQLEVAAIRGLPFKEPVRAKRVSIDEWREFHAREAASYEKAEHYWDYVRMLGIYHGPDRQDPQQLILSWMSSGASYDVRGDKILIAMELEPPYKGVALAHELYHALQDQYFDLQRYLLDKAHEADANPDEILARQSVVEGEASYVDSIYQEKLATTVLPTRQQIADVIDGKNQWNAELWEKSAADMTHDAKIRARLGGALEALRLLPPFLFERMYTPYIDGPIFIEAVHARGWSEVEKLYGEYPPVSTEQILHPGKWFAREEPVRIAWPAFKTDPLFSDWQLVAEAVLGERMWRVAFRAQGIRSEAESAAAGWNGDRYAVFRRKGDGAMLMLMYTSWDTRADADEFAAAYRLLLEAKHREAPVPARVLMQGNDVLIVEGADEASADAFLAFNGRAVLSGK